VGVGQGRGFKPVPQTGTLVHVEGYHRGQPFTAGLIMEDGVCTVAAPILRAWAEGSSANAISIYCRQPGWRAYTVQTGR
jgi:hypothetical protein